ncbi:hypothetical protein RCCGE510_31101 (plasmid) [Rhizobium sp. CCGE 510]|nr:hypothetical protein RCCGE510_31101 [Rhizobium sp. CCGE 510]
MAPTALHDWLATLPISLIVDGWYDGTMRAAFAKTGRTDVVEMQGVTRANGGGDIWTKTYDLSGRDVERVSAPKTVLYAPHGSVMPASNFLVSDSDYVEVLRVGLEKVSTISVSCQPPGEHSDVSDGYPGFC